ncbi:MAG: PAS domain S-box protein [Candidatus Kapabacteria bacterium]|nr:PAS domain S-box protein [Candidatus Kapabacteria bacterium]
MERVLLVDDMEQDLFLFRLLFKDLGYDLRYAANGAEALIDARQNPPVLIISDIQMPVMDGFALCREWLGDDKLKRIPFVFYSSTFIDEKSIEFALSLGAARFISKATDVDSFMNTIIELLHEYKNDEVQAAEPEYQHDIEFYKNYTDTLINKLEERLAKFEEVNNELNKVINDQKLVEIELRESRDSLSKRTIELNNLNYELINSRKTTLNMMEDAIDAKNEMLASENRYRQLFESAKDGIIILDAKTGLIVDVNSSLIKLLDYSRDYLIGKIIWEISFLQNIFVNEKILFEVAQKEYVRLDNMYIETVSGKGIDIEFISTVHIVNDKKIIQCNIRDISDRIIAEAALRVSEDKFRNIVETTNDIIWETDAEAMFTYINPRIEEVLGYKQEELIGRSPFELMSEDMVEEIKKLSSEIVLVQEPFQGLININLHKDGHKVIFETSGVPIFDAKNKFLGYRGINRDITERKRAEEALLESERSYRHLVDNALVGIYKVNIEGQILYGNPAMVKIIEFEGTELPKEKATDLYKNPADREILIRTIKERGEIRNFETELISFKGNVIHVIISSWLDGNVLSGMMMDITEAKKAQRELKQAEEKFRNIFENALEGIFQSTPEGKFIDANHAFASMLGYTSREELLSTVTDIRNQLYDHPEARDEWKRVVDENESVYGYLLRLMKKDGSSLWCSQSVRNVKDAQGNVLYYEGIVEDISPRVQYETELKEAKAKAEDMNRLKTNFLANMSHELRTPMSGIMGLSSLLVEPTDLEDVKELGGFIHSSSKRLMETLNLILDLSSIEAGELKLYNEEFDLLDEIKKSIDIIKMNADQKKLYLSLNCRFKECLIESDVKYICSILNNLINNAVKFTNSGGVTVSLDIETKGNDNFAAIEIKDTGIGIAEEDLEMIFEEFRQVSEGIGRNFEGNGLGLSLVKKYVELLKGTVSVESKLGEGSSFIVRLPLSVYPNRIAEAIVIDEKKDTEKVIIEEKRRKFAVLLVEDDFISVQLMKRYLNDLFDVDVATTGLGAIEMAKTKEYASILMDVNLGKGMNGIEASHEIRKIPGYEDVPIIACTAYAMKGDEEEFLNEGFNNYISKPFEKKELVNLLDEVC